jgi:outer membrane receptor protein involved in Fe transport
VEATEFFNHLQDAVTNVTVGVGPGTLVGFENAGFVPAGGVLRQRQNAGQIDAWGLEAEASQRVSPTLEFRVAGSYTVARVDGGSDAPQLTGLRPAQAPRTTATAQVAWRPVERLLIDVRGRYETSRYEDDQNLRKLHPGGTIDARVGWKLHDSVELYATGENLLDDDIQTGQTADGVYSYGQPRTVMIGINVRR